MSFRAYVKIIFNSGEDVTIPISKLQADTINSKLEDSTGTTGTIKIPDEYGRYHHLNMKEVAYWTLYK